MGVLVTGATGFLGSNLVRLLVNQGQKPRILVRERSDKRGLAGLRLDEIQGDVLDPDSLTAAMRGVEQVYHLAGIVRFEKGAQAELHNVHVNGTRNVLRAANAAGVRRLVHVSSIAAVGHGPLDHPATEQTPYNFTDHPYHDSKRAGEQMALAEAGKVEVVVANPTTLFGPYDVKPTSGAILLMVAKGLALAYPTGGNNFAGVQDVADGLIRLMQKGRPGERYILGGENLTFKELLTQCAEEAGVSRPLVPMPELPLKWVGALGDALGGVAPGLFKDLNSSLVWSMFHAAYCTSQKAITEVGYRPGPVRLAVREAYRWFQDEGMIPRDRPLTPQPQS